MKQSSAITETGFNPSLVWVRAHYDFLPPLHYFVSSMYTIQGFKFFLFFTQTPRLTKL
jgi:hypothetical protein